jgi:GDP/UDP-N,N'-diacetylbacillosamine 2-epimerase (hydrolysing)
MSQFHFVATEIYRNRVIQLGENPDYVFDVGSLGIDGLLKLNLLDRDTLQEVLDFSLGEKNLLVTFHPVTRDRNSSIQQLDELLAALSMLKDTRLIFTMPNADADGRTHSQMISHFVESDSNSCAFSSLGQLRYLSCVKHVDGVVGNSSSGIIEVPTLKKGTVNIGDRQHGRVKAASVIDCQPNRKSIYQAIQSLYSDQFKRKLNKLESPYGVGGASQLVVKLLEELPLETNLKKKFYDLPNDQ